MRVRAKIAALGLALSGIFAVSTPAVQAATSPGPLAFKPVPLTSPVTLNVTSGNVWHTLSRSRDYIVVLPKGSFLKGGLWIDGGHNVRIVGGGIQAPGKDALKIKNNSGDLYIEGVDLGGAGTTYATEGINICSPTQTSGNITIQNVKVRRVHGTEETNHADIVQYYCGHSGVKFRLERLDGTTDFQGVIFQPDNANGGTRAALWYMHNVILRRPGTTKGVLINVTNNSPSVPRSWYNVTLVSAKSNEVELRGGTQTGWRLVKPTTSVPSVLVGTPGPSYVSPGYQSAATY